LELKGFCGEIPNTTISVCDVLLLTAEANLCDGWSQSWTSLSTSEMQVSLPPYAASELGLSYAYSCHLGGPASALYSNLRSVVVDLIVIAEFSCVRAFSLMLVPVLSCPPVPAPTCRCQPSFREPESTHPRHHQRHFTCSAAFKSLSFFFHLSRLFNCVPFLSSIATPKMTPPRVLVIAGSDSSGGAYVLPINSDLMWRGTRIMDAKTIAVASRQTRRSSLRMDAMLSLRPRL
jgi:hypothetical protein